VTLSADYLLETYGGRLLAAPDGYAEADRIVAEIRAGKAIANAVAHGTPRRPSIRTDAQDNTYLLSLVRYMMRELQDKK
jgi:hypothetical protein